MNITTIFATISWGLLAGVLSIHLLGSLLGLLFCLHGLLLTRWKRLTKKAAPGQIKYDILLQLLVRVALYSLLFAILLRFGDSYMRREFWFEYRGNPAILFYSLAALSALGFLPAVLRRLRVAWKMSHQVDYAERRQRTRMLKG